MKCPFCGGWLKEMGWEIEGRVSERVVYYCPKCKAEIDIPGDRIEPWWDEIDALEECRRGRKGAIRED